MLEMKKIALEEAMIVPHQEDFVPDHKNHPEFKDNYDAVLEVGEKRIANMDAGNVEIAVLSITTPGVQGLGDPSKMAEYTTKWNEYMAEKINAHPDRFKGLACLPIYDPALAINEIERLKDRKEFVGFMINGCDTTGNETAKYLDDKRYDEMWSVIAENQTPIYVHPRGVPEGQVTTYQHYPPLHGAAWGFHVETAEHMLRLIFSGLFDRHPNIQIIIGHLGEILPFWAWRMDHRIKREGWDKKMICEKSVTHYLTNHFYITSSGYFHTPAFEHALNTMGADRVMYSVDYPYEDCKETGDWFDNLAYSESDKQKIAYNNAAKLLKL